MHSLNLKSTVTEILKFHSSVLPISISDKSAEFFLEHSEVHCQILRTEDKEYIRWKFWPKYHVCASELIKVVKNVLYCNGTRESSIFVLPIISNSDEFYIIYDKEWKAATESREVYSEIMQIDSNINQWIIN